MYKTTIYSSIYVTFSMHYIVFRSLTYHASKYDNMRILQACTRIFGLSKMIKHSNMQKVNLQLWTPRETTSHIFFTDNKSLYIYIYIYIYIHNTLTRPGNHTFLYQNINDKKKGLFSFIFLQCFQWGDHIKTALRTEFNGTSPISVWLKYRICCQIIKRHGGTFDSRAWEFHKYERMRVKRLWPGIGLWQSAH